MNASFSRRARRAFRALVCTLGLTAAGVAPALAQADLASPEPVRSNTRGLLVGLHLEGASWSLEEEEPQGGGGFSLTLGYGVSNLVTLQANLAAASVSPEVGDDYLLGHLDVGAQFHFRSDEKAWRPYAQIFLSAVNAQWDESAYGDAELSGGALSFGGGVKYFVRPTLALGLDLRLSGGSITGVETETGSGDVDLAMGSSRLGLGLAWFPLR